jgi:hypothetical protein
MNDPRFNSVHLPAPRRQDYRRARVVLFDACGNHTLVAAEPKSAEPSGSHTIHQNLKDVAPPVESEFWLMDRDYIYPLKPGLNSLGRSPDNDVVVPDEFISRRHCAIVVHVHNHAVELHDTASKNGTFLNGSRLGNPMRLRPGDEIRVCDRRFTLVSRDEAPANHTKSLVG